MIDDFYTGDTRKGGKKKVIKKGTKKGTASVPLDTFLESEDGTDWNDMNETNDRNITLPSAPAGYDSTQEFRLNSNDLPKEPPFTAYLGNLFYGITEDDIKSFFENEEITRINLIKDYSGKPKGFAYVDFAKVEGLQAALERTGERLFERALKVDVAEQKHERNWKQDKGSYDKSHSRQNNNVTSTDTDPLSLDWKGARSKQSEVMTRSTRNTSNWRNNNNNSRYSKSSSYQDNNDNSTNTNESKYSWGASRTQSQNERPKLQMKRRSEGAPPLNQVADRNSTKPDPFGGAKPVDRFEVDRKRKEIIKKKEEKTSDVGGSSFDSLKEENV